MKLITFALVASAFARRKSDSALFPNWPEYSSDLQQTIDLIPDAIPLRLGIKMKGIQRYRCENGTRVFEYAEGETHLYPFSGKIERNFDGDSTMYHHRFFEFNLTAERDNNRIRGHAFIRKRYQAVYDGFWAARNQVGWGEPSTHEASYRMDMTGFVDWSADKQVGFLKSWNLKPDDPLSAMIEEERAEVQRRADEGYVELYGRDHWPEDYEWYWKEEGVTNWMFSNIHAWTGNIANYGSGTYFSGSRDYEDIENQNCQPGEDGLEELPFSGTSVLWAVPHFVRIPCAEDSIPEELKQDAGDSFCSIGPPPSHLPCDKKLKNLALWTLCGTGMGGDSDECEQKVSEKCQA